MSDRSRSVRRTPVADLVSSLPIEPLLVEKDSDPLEVMHRAAAQPQTRLLGVVDPDGVLIGVVPLLRLAEAVIARISPETLLADIVDLADAARFGHVVESRTIGDVMVPAAIIRSTATADEAFRQMHERHMSGLYVVDVHGRPTGYLDLLELTLAYVEALEADRASSSEPDGRPSVD